MFTVHFEAQAPRRTRDERYSAPEHRGEQAHLQHKPNTTRGAAKRQKEAQARCTSPRQPASARPWQGSCEPSRRSFVLSARPPCFRCQRTPGARARIGTRTDLHYDRQPLNCCWCQKPGACISLRPSATLKCFLGGSLAKVDAPLSSYGRIATSPFQP